MSLKTKMSLIMLAAAAVAAVFGYGIQQYIVMPSFASLERGEAEKDLQRCVEAIERKVYHLDALCVDWSAWNDTCQFVQDHNRNEGYPLDSSSPNM